LNVRRENVEANEERRLGITSSLGASERFLLFMPRGAKTFRWLVSHA